MRASPESGKIKHQCAGCVDGASASRNSMVPGRGFVGFVSFEPNLRSNGPAPCLANDLEAVLAPTPGPAR